MLKLRFSYNARKRGTSFHFFHSSSIVRDAFHYIDRYQSQMPEELKAQIQENQQFAIVANTIAQNFMREARDLKDIRNLYTSPNLDEKLEAAAKIYSEKCEVDIYKLINISRLIRKFVARDKMAVLNFQVELDAIHANNLHKYGNPIAPTPSFLDKKYYHDPQKIAKAATRFRPLDEVNKIFHL